MSFPSTTMDWPRGARSATCRTARPSVVLIFPGGSVGQRDGWHAVSCGHYKATRARQSSVRRAAQITVVVAQIVRRIGVIKVDHRISAVELGVEVAIVNAVRARCAGARELAIGDAAIDARVRIGSGRIRSPSTALRCDAGRAREVAVV